MMGTILNPLQHVIKSQNFPLLPTPGSWSCFFSSYPSPSPSWISKLPSQLSLSPPSPSSPSLSSPANENARSSVEKDQEQKRRRQPTTWQALNEKNQLLATKKHVTSISSSKREIFVWLETLDITIEFIITISFKADLHKIRHLLLPMTSWFRIDLTIFARYQTTRVVLL